MTLVKLYRTYQVKREGYLTTPWRVQFIFGANEDRTNRLKDRELTKLSSSVFFCTVGFLYVNLISSYYINIFFIRR